jgi:hypothetical protein
MSRVQKYYCDKCGKEIDAINNAQLSQKTARIDLYPVGVARTCPSQRIDLCEDCFQEFINFLEK